MNENRDSSQTAWYVVRSKPRQEFRALEHLQNQGHTCFLPTLQTEKISRGRQRTAVEPLFSRYLFIRLDPSSINWTSLKSTRGVSGLLKFGERFASLPHDCMDALQNAPRTIHGSLFKPGDRVCVSVGPFAGIEGIYQAPDGEARAQILVEMLNKPQQLMFAAELLRKEA